MLDRKKIDNIVFDGIDHHDAPEYCDAHIISADYDGQPMTPDQLYELNDDNDMVYELLMEYLY